MKKVAIIILNWNSEDVTIDCLNSLSKIEYINYKIFLVDNGSIHPDILIKNEVSPNKIRYINLKYNYGYTGGNNVGIEIAKKEYRPDYYLLLNNDTILDKYFLSIMVKSFELDQNIGVVVPKIYFHTPDNYIYYAGGYIDYMLGIGRHQGDKQKDSLQFDFSKNVGFANGCSMLVKDEVFKNVGLLNKYFFANIEDAEFSYRVIKNKYKIYYNHKAILWHREGFASKKNKGQWFRIYLSTRNIILFQRERFGYLLFFAFCIYFGFRWVLYMEIKLLLKKDLKVAKR